MSLNPDRWNYLTFDCYGTLIDWESGILEALHPLISRSIPSISAQEILQLYTIYESELQTGPYQPYRAVLRGILERMAINLGFELRDAEAGRLEQSLCEWKPFEDTVAALRTLKTRYQLAIVSNIDDDLFTATQQHLQVPFDFVITAQQVGSYKPSFTHFHTALERLNAKPEEVLHVAQSLYHDHVPAKQLGFTTVWVNRPSKLPGTGLALPAVAHPDIEVSSMRELVAVLGL